MRPCKCGRAVRLGAFKIRRPTGVHHYIAHVDGSPGVPSEWQCTALKPYPKDPYHAEYSQLIARWEAATQRMAPEEPK